VAGTRQKFPFRGNARQRVQRVGTFTFVPGGRLSIELPRVGYLAGIYLQFAGGLTRTAGDTGNFSDQFFNLMRRIQVNLNIGASQIVDVSGHGLNLINQAMSFNYAADLGGDGNAALPAPLDATADTLVFSGTPAVPQTAQPLVFTYWVPIAMNDGLNFGVGLINLQAPEIRCTLDLQMGDLTDLFAPGSVLTGTSFGVSNAISVQYLYYEVPNPDLVDIPPYIVHRLSQERQSIAATGDQVYTIPRMGQLQRVIHSVQLNGVTSTGLVTDLVIRVNKTDEIYRQSQSFNRFLSRMRYGHKVPRGAFYHDWWRAADLNAAGDFRDVIDTEQISTLEAIVGINQAAVLGSGNNFLDTIREFTQRLA
jgi:hypothetical protein